LRNSLREKHGLTQIKRNEKEGNHGWARMKSKNIENVQKEGILMKILVFIFIFLISVNPSFADGKTGIELEAKKLLATGWAHQQPQYAFITEEPNGEESYSLYVITITPENKKLLKQYPIKKDHIKGGLPQSFKADIPIRPGWSLTWDEPDGKIFFSIADPVEDYVHYLISFDCEKEEFSFAGELMTGSRHHLFIDPHSDFIVYSYCPVEIPFFETEIYRKNPAADGSPVGDDNTKKSIADYLDPFFSTVLRDDSFLLYSCVSVYPIGLRQNRLYFTTLSLIEKEPFFQGLIGKYGISVEDITTYYAGDPEFLNKKYGLSLKEEYFYSINLTTSELRLEEIPVKDILNNSPDGKWYVKITGEKISGDEYNILYKYSFTFY
jgi:hypothetical protein